MFHSHAPPRLPPLTIAAYCTLGAASMLLGACQSSASGASMEELLARVDARLNDAEPDMIACFNRELTDVGGRVSGRIAVRVEIDSDGLVNNLEVLESSLGHPQADLCVADTIRRIFFEEWVDRRPVRVTKPFRFNDLGRP